MRPAILVVLVACGQEYNPADAPPVPFDGDPDCVAVDEFVLCSARVPFAVAEQACADMGAILADTPTSYDEQMRMAELGVTMWPEDQWWWAGWPESWIDPQPKAGHDCTRMSYGGSAAPGDCAALRPFMCERVRVLDVE